MSTTPPEGATVEQIVRPPAAQWVPAFVTLSALWGSSFLFIKVGVETIPPMYVALGRLAVGAVVLLVVLAITRTGLPREWRLWAHMALSALFLNSIPFALFAFGEQRIPSVLAGIWNATTPLWTLVFAFALLADERPTPRRVVGLMLGFVGVLVVLGPWRGIGSAVIIGSLACIAAAGCYGIGTAYSRRFVSGKGHRGLSLAAAQLICATAWLALATPFAPRPAAPSTSSVLAVVALGALGTGFAFALYWLLLPRVGATTTTTVTYLVPLWSTLLGVIVLGESLTWNEPVGALVVLLGVAVAEGLLRRRNGAAESA